MDNGIYSTSAFHPNQLAEPPSSRNIQDNSSMSSVPSTSNSEAANLPQNYSYAGYPSSDSYGFGNTGYAGYYGGYQQQQSNQSYPQRVGAYQNTGAYQSTGAPHQLISSFQNTVPYTGPENYSSTYYNPGDYQTSGSYQRGGYSNQNQANLWQQGNYANYATQYLNYTPESNGSYSSSNASATSLQYQQHYKQWADYYCQTEVSCAPGTENVSATSTVNVGCPVPGVPGGYSSANSQQPAPYTTSWKPEATSDFPSVQPSAVISSVHDGYWKQGTPGFQNHTVKPIQSNLRTPLDSDPTYGSFQKHHKPEYPQGGNVHYPANHQVPQNYHTSLQPVQQTVSQTVQQPVSQTGMPLDSRVSKMQIPTNPRIATNLALGLPKTDKENSISSATAKPVYISVAPPKTNDEMSSHNAADSILECQSQLKVLYAEGNKGCNMEFSVYNLLCVILHSNNNRDLLSAVSRLSNEARKDEAVKHALEVRAAVTSGNYVLFFGLYKAAPNLKTRLMDLYVEKMRYAAVKCMSRSYRPTLPVSYIAQVLGFSSVLPTVEPSGEKHTDGLEECVEWLKAHGACLITDNSGEMLLDSKSSTSSLFMPEPEDAVTHGDATLAVNDFLTRTPL